MAETASETGMGELNRSLAALRLEVPGEVADHHEKIVRDVLDAARHGSLVGGDEPIDVRADKVARAFHEAYERLALDLGYETREASAKPWADVPEQNKTLMVAVVRELFDAGVIAAL